ncbi:sensor domain-containing protein [Catenulispora yoronensis]
MQTPGRPDEQRRQTPTATAATNTSFTKSELGPNVATGLASFPSTQTAETLLTTISTAMKTCTTLTETDKDGSSYDFGVAALPFPETGDGSSATRMSADIGGYPAQVDIVVVRIGSTLLYVANTGLGGTDSGLTQDVVARAVGKVEGAEVRFGRRLAHRRPQAEPDHPSPGSFKPSPEVLVRSPRSRRQGFAYSAADQVSSSCKRNRSARTTGDGMDLISGRRCCTRRAADVSEGNEPPPHKPPAQGPECTPYGLAPVLRGIRGPRRRRLLLAFHGF